jgi:hypothetical protein
MKQIVFYQLSGIGDGKSKEEGSVLDLLEAIPYLLLRKRLPGLQVINAILAQGYEDAGMSGAVQWQSFQIDEDEFQELISEAESRGISYKENPEWVSSRSDFHIWEMSLDHGIPVERHRELTARMDQAEAHYEEAKTNDTSQEQLDFLLSEVLDAGSALSSFLEGYLSRKKELN